MIKNWKQLSRLDLNLGHIFFLFGNSDFIKDSFIIQIQKELNAEVQKIQSISKISTYESNSLFQEINTSKNLYVMNVTDKNYDMIEDLLNHHKSKNDYYIFVDQDYKKSKKINTLCSTSNNVISIGCFEKNTVDFISYILEPFPHLKQYANSITTHCITTHENPCDLILKISLADNDDIDKLLLSSNSYDILNNTEPIGFLRYLYAISKYNSTDKLLSGISNQQTNKNNLVKSLNELEIFFKKNNLKAQFFIQNKFLKK